MIEHAIPATILTLLTPFAGIFSRPAFENFQTLLVGWILCPGRHTISRVIQASAEMRRRRKKTPTGSRPGATDSSSPRPSSTPPASREPATGRRTGSRRGSPRGAASKATDIATTAVPRRSGSTPAIVTGDSA